MCRVVCPNDALAGYAALRCPPVHVGTYMAYMAYICAAELAKKFGVIPWLLSEMHVPMPLSGRTSAWVCGRYTCMHSTKT